MVRQRRDNLTRELFEWEPPKVAVGYSSEVHGSGPLDQQIARLIGHALRNFRDNHDVNRADIAQRMAAYLSRPV